jgi:hypothetical protein
MRLTSHVRFWSGGGGGDPFAYRNPCSPTLLTPLALCGILAATSKVSVSFCVWYERFFGFLHHLWGSQSA